MTAPSPSSSFFVQGPDGPLCVQRWGDPAKPVIVLVHGYPDNRSEWAPVAERLADRHCVVAYDVRGAGDSFKPTRRADYRLERLCADFQAVVDAVSPSAPIHLVGHDWGSIQCWRFVTDPALQGRIASFTSCSGPYLDHAGWKLREVMRHPTRRDLGLLLKQALKSWYIYFFQLPWLPQALWRAWAGPRWPQLMRVLEHTRIEPRPTQTADGVHGIRLYQGNIFQHMARPRPRRAHAPVQLLVPMKDRFVSPWMTEGLERWAPSLVRKELPDARHWVPISHPQDFAWHVQAFIAQVQEPRETSGRNECDIGSAWHHKTT